MLPDGSYGGNPSGFVLWIGNRKLYFACDTALFYDMKLIGELGIDVAVLPIGDQFTMGPADSIRATKLIEPKIVVPSHYDTWPPIHQDADAWAARCAAKPGPSRGYSLRAARLSLTPRKVRHRQAGMRRATGNPGQWV